MFLISSLYFWLKQRKTNRFKIKQKKKKRN